MLAIAYILGGVAMCLLVPAFIAAWALGGE